jgi:hypothetical protein
MKFEWIPLKKRMPPYGERILVVDDTGEVYEDKREDANHFQLGPMSWRKSWQFGQGTRLVAWAPLPDPPKELCKHLGERFSASSPLVGPWNNE